MTYKFLFTRDGFGIIVDPEDYESLTAYTWFIASGGYAMTRMGKRAVSMHRLLLSAPKDKVVDHINGVRHDNRKKNLRICDEVDNLRNRKIGKNNTSSYKGVSIRNDRKKWTAQIKHNDKYYYLGNFDNPHDAALAYNEKAEELHGNFAKLNIIRRTE